MAAVTTTSRAPALRRKRSGGAGELSRKVGATSVMWLLAIVYGFPVLWFLLSSFKPPGELFSYPLTLFPKHPTVTGYAKAWTTFDVAQYFLNTLIVAVSATALTIVASAA